MALGGGSTQQQSLDNIDGSIIGSCLCGGITVTIKQHDLFEKPTGHTCHCENCRKMSSAPFVCLLMIRTSDVHISDPKGLLRIFRDNNSLSGRTALRPFCSECGSPTACASESEPRLSLVALGLFPRMPQPEFELFTSHRQDWTKQITSADTQYQLAKEAMQYAAPLLQ